LLVAVVVVAVAAGVALLTGGSEPRPVAVRQPAPTTTTTTTPVNPDAGPFTIATTAVQALAIHADPSGTGAPIATLGPTSEYGLPTTLAVSMEPIPVVEGWLPVILPYQKPNGTLGWVQESHVTASQTSYLIRVHLGERRLVLLDGGQEVLSVSVIIGTPETPTPLGRFYVTDPINCNAAEVPAYPVGQCDAAYGRFAMGTSGLSEALDSFAGTIPQIAIHGTSLPDTELGKELSNGCVRVQNDVILQLAQTVPLGTPVDITA
jgi:lipoprotein-anchoring transpeptidase ErfK/SrfK